MGGGVHVIVHVVGAVVGAPAYLSIVRVHSEVGQQRLSRPLPYLLVASPGVLQLHELLVYMQQTL